MERYLVLTKPRIVTLVMMTAGAGFWMAQPTGEQLFKLFHLLLGTALVAGGTNALNQVFERDVDALMHRTRNRPLPTGRLAVVSATTFAWSAGLAGVAYLALLVNLLTGMLALATLISYVFLYTPLKRRTSLATLVGAIPGALPIVGGWTAARGAITPEAWVLFAIMFFWQLPHFLALAWMYREDYARAGLNMLSVRDDDGRITFIFASLYAGALIPVSLAPTLFGIAGPVYFVGAGLLSGAFLLAAMIAARRVTQRNALVLFKTSLAYLPLLLILMGADRGM
jgi:protoheme IX farnesyltransferase